MSAAGTIQVFVPTLRTNVQFEAFRTALQMLGDFTGLGITYFDFGNTGCLKATRAGVGELGSGSSKGGSSPVG
ncbi:hypothetical protein HMPREF1868_00607 [Olsenella sp. DNF00959]|nr:hypothetical protein HMPREF1868_00607 [Olsenella sp. DNF00959]